jgi:hypothetical protein
VPIDFAVGTGGKLASRFDFRRVKVAHYDGTEAKDREPQQMALSDLRRGLNATSPILSSPYDLQSRARLPAGFRAVPSFTERVMTAAMDILLTTDPYIFRLLLSQ